MTVPERWVLLLLVLVGRAARNRRYNVASSHVEVAKPGEVPSNYDAIACRT